MSSTLSKASFLVRSTSPTAAEMAALHLSAAQETGLRAHLEAAWPQEGCGLLIGRPNGRVCVIWPAANVAADPYRGFEIDSPSLFAAHRHARDHGLTVIGHFHSHPDGSPRPSPRDLARAEDRNEIWVIGAMAGGTVRRLRAFRLDRDVGRIEELAIRIDLTGDR